MRAPWANSARCRSCPATFAGLPTPCRCRWRSSTMSTISSPRSPAPPFSRDSPSSPWPPSRSSNGAMETPSRPPGATELAGSQSEAITGTALAIRAEGLTMSLGRTAAVADLDLDVRPGELLALLGPSGSGKTTLLRLVAGLEIPTGGRILFDEEDATRLSVRERRVGFVFQNYALFKHLTVAENVAYGLRVKSRRLRPSKAGIARRVDDLLELVQLVGLGKRYPPQLSGRQLQRVALARAL